MHSKDNERLARWVEGYRAAWISNARDAIEALFTPDAVYWSAPYAAPSQGRAAIVSSWLARKDQPGDTDFSFEVLALVGDLGFVQGRTLYRTPPPREYRNLWVVRLDEAGSCREFTEWWMQVPD